MSHKELAQNCQALPTAVSKVPLKLSLKAGIDLFW